MDIWCNAKSHVIHSLHNSWADRVYLRGKYVFCAECVPLYICVFYVGKRVWTFQRYCWRFSVRPSGKGQRGVR